MIDLSTESSLELALKYFYILCVFQTTRTHIRNARASLYDLTWRILSSLGYYKAVCSYVLYYLFRLFVLYLLVRVFVLYLLHGCLIPNTLLWSPLCLLVSGTKYSLTILLSLTLFYILFYWYDYHYQVSKLLKYNALRRLGHEISYHVICGAPICIQFLLTDTVSDERERNVNVLGAIAT